MEEAVNGEWKESWKKNERRYVDEEWVKMFRKNRKSGGREEERNMEEYWREK